MAAFLVCGTGATWGSPTWAAGVTDEMAEKPAWVADIRVGPALLMHSRSKAPQHLIKPELRLGARRVLPHNLEIGAALVALLDGSEHYRVAGALAHGRWAALAWKRFSAGLSLALGVGYGADILSSDLRVDTPVLPYGFVAADARWAIGSRYGIGVELAWENLGMLALGATVMAGF